MKDIVILIPNQKCLLKIRALAPVEIHQSLTNLKILKAEKEERERIKKRARVVHVFFILIFKIINN